MSEFESWLGAQLKALETDDEVYLPYIVSILEDEDDKSAAIDDLLSGISDKEAENKALRIQILERWDRLQGGVGEGEPEVDGKLDHAHTFIHICHGWRWYFQKVSKYTDTRYIHGLAYILSDSS